MTYTETDMNTKPRQNLIMIDYARHDDRSAAVRSLGRRAVPFSKDMPAHGPQGAGGRFARLATAAVGLALGVGLVLVLSAG